MRTFFRNIVFVLIFLGSLFPLDALGAKGPEALLGALAIAIGSYFLWGILHIKNWTEVWRQAPGTIIFFEFLFIGGLGIGALFLLGIRSDALLLAGFLLANTVFVYCKYLVTGEVIY